jgi:O-antigen/teichoic acid export membrane protein
MLKRIGKFSAGASIIHASNRLIYRLDTVVAGIFLSAAAVTSYAIPLILIDQFRMFAESGNGILTPRFSKLAAAGDQQTIRYLLLRWSRYSFLLALAIGTPLLITGGDFLELWMGRSFPDAQAVLTILTLPFLLTMPAMVFTYYLYATNRHSINARILALEAALNLILSLVLVQHLGLVGIALGTLIPAVLCRALLLPIRACATGIIQVSEYVRSSFLSCIPLALIHAALLAMTRQLVGSGTWIGFLVCNALALGVFAAAVWGLYLSDEEKAYLGRRLGLTARG